MSEDDLYNYFKREEFKISSGIQEYTTFPNLELLLKFCYWSEWVCMKKLSVWDGVTTDWVARNLLEASLSQFHHIITPPAGTVTVGQEQGTVNDGELRQFVPIDVTLPVSPEHANYFDCFGMVAFVLREQGYTTLYLWDGSGLEPTTLHPSALEATSIGPKSFQDIVNKMYFSVRNAAYTRIVRMLMINVRY